MSIVYDVLDQSDWDQFPANPTRYAAKSAHGADVEACLDLLATGAVVSVPFDNPLHRKSLLLSFSKRAKTRGLTLERKWDDTSLALRLA